MDVSLTKAGESYKARTVFEYLENTWEIYKDDEIKMTVYCVDEALEWIRSAWGNEMSDPDWWKCWYGDFSIKFDFW